MSPSPQRRTVLTAGAAAAVALLATACTSGAEGEAPPGAPPPSPEAEVLARAAEQSRVLLRGYDATSRAHPSLAEALAPLRAAVARHVAEFSGEEGPKEPDNGGAADAGKAAAKAPAAKVPDEPRAALGALLDAERRTVDARFEALDTAPPEVAMVLASAAAAGAVHGYLLTELRAKGA